MQMCRREKKNENEVKLPLEESLEEEEGKKMPSCDRTTARREEKEKRKEKETGVLFRKKEDVRG